MDINKEKDELQKEIISYELSIAKLEKAKNEAIERLQELIKEEKR